MTDITLDSELNDFKKHGVHVFKAFYDVEKEIYPIINDIYEIIGIVLSKYGITVQRAPFSAENFDDGYLELCAVDRRYGGEVYDAIKQIGAYATLIGNPKNLDLMKRLRDTDLVGVIGRGCGMRIDSPHEDGHMTGWHQDYPGQLRSLDGCVFWSPLAKVTAEHGPVEFCLGSHHDGIRPLYRPETNQHSKNSTMYGTALRIHGESDIVSGYEKIAPLSEPGDLVVIDFLTLHRSQMNLATRPRWSMQMRYFNYREPTGVKYGWPVSYAFGKSMADVQPEYFLEDTDQ